MVQWNNERFFLRSVDDTKELIVISVPQEAPMKIITKTFKGLFDVFAEVDSSKENEFPRTNKGSNKWQLLQKG